MITVDTCRRLNAAVDHLKAAVAEVCGAEDRRHVATPDARRLLDAAAGRLELTARRVRVGALSGRGAFIDIPAR